MVPMEQCLSMILKMATLSSLYAAAAARCTGVLPYNTTLFVVWLPNSKVHACREQL